MVLDELSADLSAAELVGALSDPRRCFQAYQQLRRLGAGAGAAARGGLRHPSAQVREYCCLVLDHLMDAESGSALVDALDHAATLPGRSAPLSDVSSRTSSTAT